jgi:hypothetical protein
MSVAESSGPVSEKTDTAPQEPEKPRQTVQRVDIRNMAVKKKGKAVRIRFDVVNTHPKEKTVGGYVHILARDVGSDPPKTLAYPKQTLREGSPVDYRSGQRFLIRRFKPMTGRIRLEHNGPSPPTIKVLVYGQDGTLALEKEFNLGDVS